MRGNTAQHWERTVTVEQAQRAHKEECERRLAKAMNTPKEKVNTPWPEDLAEKAPVQRG
jgi:hypothetical protein